MLGRELRSPSTTAARRHWQSHSYPPSSRLFTAQTSLILSCAGHIRGLGFFPEFRDPALFTFPVLGDTLHRP